MAFGLIDTQYIDFAEGQTDARLRSLQNRLGINFTEFVNRVDSAVGAINTPDPLVSALTYRTDQDLVQGQFGSSRVFGRQAEYTVARPQRGAGRGHSIPFYFNEIGLGFTRRALELISLTQFENELRDTVQAVRRGVRADVLERLYDPDEFPLDDDGNGASPGFAGSGTGANAFVGTLPGGAQTDASYTHYGFTTQANLATAIDTFLGRVRNFHPAPYDLIGSPDAIAMVMELAGFVPSGSALVRPGIGTAEALVDPNQYVGVYDGVLRVRSGDYQIDGDAIAIVKTYGDNNLAYPLAWRFDPGFGEGAYVEDRQLYPLAEALVQMHYGVGANRRTGAALISIGAETAYTPPAILR